MGLIINKAVKFLSKNWKKIAAPFAALATGFASFFLGKNLEKRKAEKEIAKLQKAIRKQEAELMVLESSQKKSSSDKRKIKRLIAKNKELEAQRDSAVKNAEGLDREPSRV